MIPANSTESDNDEHKFHIADYVVFGAALSISLGIGVFHAIMAKRKNNPDEYLVGGRSMGFLPTAISLIVSFESSILMLGSPAEIYVFGYQYLWSWVGKFIADMLAINIIAPLIHPLKITSAYEYLEMRFQSRAVRLLGTVFGVLSTTIYMGIVLFGPAVALEAVAGYPLVNSILVISIVAVIYTSIGGFKAVIWADVFQSVIMLTGIFAILIQGTIAVGGPVKVWNTASAAGRMNFFNFDLDPRVRHTFWGLIFSAFLRSYGLLFNQSSIQRISSTKTLGEAKSMLLFTAPIFLIASVVTAYEGIVTYSYYHIKGCDPIASKQITNPNQLIPYTVMEIFSSLRGMPGLFLASLFSASLSTLSSGLASCAAITWSDIIEPMVGDISEGKSTLIIKIIVVVFGGVACSVSFLVAEIGGTLTQISSTLISVFAAPLTAVFFLGCFVPRSNAKGTIMGAIAGLTACTWLAMGQNFSPNIPKAAPLPSAPTDTCYVGQNSLALNTSQVTASWLEAGESVPGSSTSIYLTTESSTPGSPAPAPEVTGIEVIYTLSYLYIAPTGIITTMVVAYVISFFTGFNKPGDVNPRCLLSFADSVLLLLPGRARRFVSSLGPQFMAKEHMSNFEDPKEKDIEMDSKSTIQTISNRELMDSLEHKNGNSYTLQESYKF